MKQSLLKFYHRELAYLRRSGAEFARQYPKIAGRLGINDEHVEDPHVSRLLEGVAFLTARIRQKLEDSFSEICSALLGQLFPDYHAPIPSMSILHFTTRNINDAGVLLKKSTEIKARRDVGSDCLFQTAYDVNLLPCHVVEAEFSNAPYSSPQLDPAMLNLEPGIYSRSVLKLVLRCDGEEVNWTDLGTKRLRFYLNGPRHHANSLYEKLMRDCLSIAIVGKAGSQPQFIPSSCLKPVGFDEDQALIPYSNRHFPAYRLLSELFLFPEKYLFLELETALLSTVNHSDLTLYFYFHDAHEELPRQIDSSRFLLNCTPVINLFKQSMETVRYQSSEHEYQLVPQYMDADEAEIVRIESVQAFDNDAQPWPILPLYAQSHPAFYDADKETKKPLFWHSRREQVEWAGGKREPGTEVFISIADQALHKKSQSTINKDWVLNVNCLCSNRNLPANLPQANLDLDIDEHRDLIEDIKAVRSFTPSVRAAIGDHAQWQLVNHLTLNQFTADQGVDQLKQTLKLYDFLNRAETRVMIEGIVSMKTTIGTSRVNQGGQVAFCSGTEIELTLDPGAYEGNGLFLFAAVLNHFFSQYATINTYTCLSIRLLHHEEIYHRFPPRSGNRVLL